MEPDRIFGAFSGRIGLRDLGDIGVCLLGVVYSRTSLLQEPQRSTRVSRASRRAQGVEVVEWLEMEPFGQLSTLQRLCHRRVSDLWRYFAVSFHLGSSHNFPVGGGINLTERLSFMPQEAGPEYQRGPPSAGASLHLKPMGAAA